MKSKQKRELLDRIEEGGFDFHVFEDGTDVYLGRRCIGSIVGMKEANGRHCFRLGCDTRKEPRTYRGRVKAAEALEVIDQLARAAKRYRWTPEDLIIRCWDEKPHASPKQEK